MTPDPFSSHYGRVPKNVSAEKIEVAPPRSDEQNTRILEKRRKQREKLLRAFEKERQIKQKAREEKKQKREKRHGYPQYLVSKVEDSEWDGKIHVRWRLRWKKRSAVLLPGAVRGVVKGNEFRRSCGSQRQWQPENLG